jgi:hypothetical protein
MSRKNYVTKNGVIYKMPNDDRSYSELLKDPRWQRKRLEILELDRWQCRHCESKKNTLHVHHLYYIKGKMPWEYDNSALITYCEECHDAVKNINWQKAFFDSNLTEYDLLEIALHIQLKKRKHDEKMREINERMKARNPWYYMYLQLFEDEDEIGEFYSEGVDKKRSVYTNG